ncbi:MAG: methyltransferase domain-containing protein [Sinobacterium sp.]|nr:methyltransferase domain-containing protein [Sinobacterium sp.]
MDEQAYIEALVDLHTGLQRQGPGDAAFSKKIISELLANLPESVKALDLGCGTGAATLLLAEQLSGSIQAVDASAAFISTLQENLAHKTCKGEVEASVEDFSQLPSAAFPVDSYDLLWSEGAAYTLGFSSALKTWRPLLKKGGVAVISEMSWFAQKPSADAYDFWSNAYPDMATEAVNIELAKQHGFELLKAIRLPTKAWWDNYYNPLLQRMQQLRLNVGMNADQVLFDVLDDTDAEIELFSRFSDEYGYTFYILRAI